MSNETEIKTPETIIVPSEAVTAVDPLPVLAEPEPAMRWPFKRPAFMGENGGINAHALAMEATARRNPAVRKRMEEGFKRQAEEARASRPTLRGRGLRSLASGKSAADSAAALRATTPRPAPRTLRDVMKASQGK